MFYLVLSITFSVSQGSTGWTNILRVTRMHDFVGARVNPDANIGTSWCFGTTSNGWVHDLGSTVTSQLVKGDVRAGKAVAFVTRFIAPVRAARQELATGEWAHVVNVNAARLVTFVSTTRSLLGASFITPHIIGSGFEFSAGQL